MFDRLLDQIREQLVTVLMLVEIRMQEPEEVPAAGEALEAAPANESTHSVEMTGEAPSALDTEAQSQEERFAAVGRNDPCPCGSGRRFKECCGKLK